MDSIENGPAGAAPPPRRHAALVEGEPARVLAVSTVPLAGALVVLFGIQLAEAWLTGLLGATALAALGFAIPVVMTAMSFGIGLGAGASAVVARALGAGEPGVAGRSRHALVLSGAVALAVALPGWLGAPWLLAAMGAEGAVHAEALGYLRLWFLGAPPLLVGMVALSLIRAAGDTGFQGAALAGAGALAFALDWPFAFGVPGLFPGLGLAGLAVAAGLSWAAMLALSLWRLRRLGLLGGQGAKASAAPRFATSSRAVLQVGLPAAATNAIIPLATGLFTAMLAAHGTAAVAGFGIGSRVEALAMTAFFALSAVANPFAAQNQGAGRLDRVQVGMRAAMLFCAGYGLALSALLAVAGPMLARLFTGDAAVSASAALYLAVLPWGFGAVGAIAVANAAFNGLGRPMAAVAVSMLRTFVLGVPLAWLGGRLAGEVGTLSGILLANVVAGTVAAVWILRATRPRRG